MANIVIPPGARTLTVPITVTPSGQSYSALVYLSSDLGGLNAVATGAQVQRTSTGATQNVPLTITVPSSGVGMSAFVVVYVGGQYYGTFTQTTTVTIGGVTVGEGVWS